MFLFLVFEITDENDMDEIQFSNLTKFRNKIKDYILDEFKFNEILKNLYGIICMPSINHSTAYCHKCNVE